QFNAGTLLILNTSNAVSASYNLNGGTVVSNIAGGATMAGSVNIMVPTTFNGANQQQQTAAGNPLLISAALSGSAPITVTGPIVNTLGSFVAFSGTAGSTYSGSISVNANGVLRLQGQGGDGTLGTIPITLNGGTAMPGIDDRYSPNNAVLQLRDNGGSSGPP